MSFLEELAKAALSKAVTGQVQRIAIVGYSPDALDVRGLLSTAGLEAYVAGIFDPYMAEGNGIVRPWAELRTVDPDLVIVALDGEKERMLRAVTEILPAGRTPAVALAGTAHLLFDDELFSELDAPALVRSYATGYEYTRVHMFQCLEAAAANGLTGAVVEFGAFKGGTTSWLARVVERLGISAKVIAFDSWSGFPPRRSLLDLYEHPRCVFSDIAAVQAYLKPLDVEVVEGDIVQTAARLADEPILLAFIDTDNYSPAKAALDIVLPNLVPGGAIVLDHFETTEDYIYTVGERMAATEVLKDAGLLHLHGTGVFIRVR